ncbi:MAG: TonB-dependent receptor [Bacteroides sp.]|nr:TonB-dependent receptor [Bacteroides sp.]
MDAHTLRFMGGYSWKDDNSESMNMENRDFSYDNFLWNNIGNGGYLQKGEATMGSGKSLSKLIGVFGRINYNWNDIIMGAASLRYEGSTKFGPNNKWGYFPAVSLAIEVANMPFMASQKEWINSLKPRVSYGITGRAGSSYQSQTTYSSGNFYLMDGEWMTTFGPARNPNPDIGWEKGITTNIGFDFEVFGRLRGSMEYFDRRSKDLLYNYTAPQPPMIYNNITVNIGTTVNTGFELNLNADTIVTKNLTRIPVLSTLQGKPNLPNYQTMYIRNPILNYIVQVVDIFSVWKRVGKLVISTDMNMQVLMKKDIY